MKNVLRIILFCAICLSLAFGLFQTEAFNQLATGEYHRLVGAERAQLPIGDFLCYEVFCIDAGWNS